MAHQVTIQLYNGNKSNLAGITGLSAGEPIFCKDTKELFVATASGNGSDALKISDVFFQPSSYTPTVAEQGKIWVDTTNVSLKYFDGIAWVTTSPDLTPFVKHDGTVAMTGDLNLNSHKITNLSDGSVNSDAATYGQLTSLIGSLANGIEWQDSCQYFSNDSTSPSLSSITTGDRVLVVESINTTSGIVAEGVAVNAFVGKEGNIAIKTAIGYDFVIPTPGTCLTVDSITNGIILRGTSAWSAKFYEATTVAADIALSLTGREISLNLATDSGLFQDANGLKIVTVDGGSF